MDKPNVTDGSGVLTGDGAPGSAVATPSAHPRQLPSDWLDRVVVGSTDHEGFTVERFLSERSPWKALAIWLGEGARSRKPPARAQVIRRLVRDIARLDAVLSRQVNAILHHPAFQRMEASWRGLSYLVHQLPEGTAIKIRVLNISWKELYRDQERALEFDQSQLFRKIYGEEFGTPGGEPYGVLLADYEIRPRPGPDHPTDDIGALGTLAGVAAASFAPFIAGAHPSMLDLESFTELERPLNLPKTFEQLEYLKWRSFRDLEDARFVGLTLPRVLMRLPYRDSGNRVDGFRFREDVEEPGRRHYLWGTAVYAFGAVLIRSFTETGWMASIRGAQRGSVGGGMVTGLPVVMFRTDKYGLMPRCSTDAILSDAHEKELGELGFICLSHCQDTELAVFYGNASVQKPKVYDEMSATINARLSSMLQYMLCVARFAHYIKVIARDKLGSFTGPGDCEEYLRKWLSNYTTTNEKAGDELKAQYPLREAKVEVRERPDKPGTYSCVTHLRPHFQLDQLVTAVKLVTQLVPGQPG